MDSNLAYQENYSDPRREELHHGQVVLMAPSPNVNHNSISSNIFRIFDRYLDKKRCKPFMDGTDVYLTEDDVFVPDMMVVCDRSKIKWNGIHGAPDLVVEVLSLGTAKRDRGYKKDVYEKSGVREYWIVSPQEKTVEVYLLEDGHFRLDGAYSLVPEKILRELKEKDRKNIISRFKCSLYDDLTIDLEDVFDDLLEDIY